MRSLEDESYGEIPDRGETILLESGRELFLVEEGILHPLEERAPTYDNQDQLILHKPDELIWLTPNAVRERLFVYFRKYLPSRIEGNKPTSTEETLSILKNIGFTFSEKDGQRVMLVDATIPVEENTDGVLRLPEIPEPINVSNAAADGYLSSEQARQRKPHYNINETPRVEPAEYYTGDICLGFRPITSRSAYCIAVPIDILEGELKKTIDYFSYSHWDISSNRFPNHSRDRVIKEVVNNHDLFYQVKDIIGDVNWVYSSDEHGNSIGRLPELPKEKQWKIFQLYMNLGWDADRIQNSGFLPYEPICHFEIQTISRNEGDFFADPFPLPREDSIKRPMRRTAFLTMRELAEAVYQATAMATTPDKIRPKGSYGKDPDGEERFFYA